MTQGNGAGQVSWTADMAEAVSEGPATLDGATALPALDSVGGVSADATHVDGALAVDGAVAAHLARVAASAAPVACPLALAAVTQFAVMLPEQPETLTGSLNIAAIDVAEPGGDVVTLASMGDGMTASPSPRGFLDPLWLAARSARGSAPVLLETDQAVWTDPASVAGAAELVIGQATLILSNWPQAR